MDSKMIMTCRQFMYREAVNQNPSSPHYIIQSFNIYNKSQDASHISFPVPVGDSCVYTGEIKWMCNLHMHRAH